jgi:Domain of unknown function (DUF5060)/Protein of unknown function (DUF4038)/Putative collagen-binding domain of a collagenase
VVAQSRWCGAVFLLAAIAGARAQTPCASPAVWMPCDLSMELTADEAAKHPNPYADVELQAEFRSPSKKKTYRIPAFWDGERKIVVRLGPTETGVWDYKLTSNIPRFNDKAGTLNVAESQYVPHIHNANVHHWQNALLKQHLWMGETIWRIGLVPRGEFDAILTARAAQSFTHLRGLILGEARDLAQVWQKGLPAPSYFQELDARVTALNQKGIIFDAVIAETPDVLRAIAPGFRERDQFVRYLMSRYAPFNVTWEVTRRFEEGWDGRPLVKDFGEAIKKQDPYEHPRSTGAGITSSPLLGDQWMNFISSTGADNDLGAIEHQLYQLPQVNAVTAANADAQRKALWNAAMSGQYPIREATSETGADFWKHWFAFFADTRYWELEPYFAVDGGRAVALVREFDPEDIDPIEYILYVEKPGPVEVRLHRHSYNLRWYNPVNGEWTVLKDFKNDKWAGEPPTSDHDWVLHISREGKKASMLTSYKFDSRPVPVQEVDNRAPYEIVEPSGNELSLSKPFNFQAKVRRDTRGTRSMMYLWTVEVNAEGQGFRVIGTGAKGTFRMPADLAKKFPATVLLRVAAVNANGKAYSADKLYKLVP